MSDVQYSPPIIIKDGGTYTGNYQSLDPNVPAVWIWTQQPVTILGCNIISAGIGIKYEGGGNATIRNNSILGVWPSNNDMKGRGIYSYKPQSFIAENNYIESTGGGIMLDQSFDTPCSLVSIKYNRIKNMDKRKTDLSEGSEHRAGVMLSSL